MQHAVERSLKVCISAHGIQIPSLLDSGSDVTLLRQSYFEKHRVPKIQAATSEKADAHHLFHLTVANNGQLPVKMYRELDINFLGLKVLNMIIYVYFWLIFNRLGQGNVLDLSLSQHQQIWHINRVISI